jgi:cell division protein FtsB
MGTIGWEKFCANWHFEEMTPTRLLGVIKNFYEEKQCILLNYEEKFRQLEQENLKLKQENLKLKQENLKLKQEKSDCVKGFAD